MPHMARSWTWREWNFSPPHRKCVNLKIDNQFSLAKPSLNNQCDYESKTSQPPSWLQHQRSTLFQDFPDFTGIDWKVSKPRENFKLTLLAKPHVKNKKECPCDPRKDFNLLQNMPNKKDSSLSIKKGVPANGTFIDIFTGCYYFVMTNREEKSWLWGPYFYNTTYPVRDPTVRCQFENVSNAVIETSRILPFNLIIPTTCIEMNLKLWEIDEEKFKKASDFSVTTSPASQICHVSMVANLTFGCEYNHTNLNLSWPMEHQNLTKGAWRVKVVWEGLKEGDVCYFLELSQTYKRSIPGCSNLLFNPTQWKNYATIGRLDLPCYKKLKEPGAGWNLDELRLIAVAVLLAAILLFWILKLFRIRCGRSHMGNDVPFNTINPLLNKEKAQQNFNNLQV
ncbi:uncharacterized protein LOC107218980 isoform X2 [Neodiprion lecontei]|uniref:Uncharacterized protein LOC107218980 isoform X2 n=1 Tax=Neodiprion lecontei TaxID=441921 RepID=A0ABM3FMY3_NEOLC|nr:uncharacterized protein LOC107218980 isoform X2 [Neodiprion lecontei]